MSTFDQNKTGFGSTTFDSQENTLKNFCKKYRAEVMQSTRKYHETAPFSTMPSVNAAMDTIQVRELPVLEIRMANTYMDDLLTDWRELVNLKQFIQVTPGMMEEYSKWIFWEKLRK